MSENLIQELEKRVSACKTKRELDEAVKIFAQKSVWESLKGQDTSALAELFREQILTLILSRGEIMDLGYFYLYGLFREVAPDNRFDTYITLATTHIGNQSLGIVERFLLLELKLASMMLRGDGKRMVSELFRSMLILDIHEATNLKIDEMVRNFCALFDIPVELLFEALSGLLEAQNYRNLTPHERRSIYNWSLHVLWNVPSFFNSPKWMELYPLWRANFYEHLERDEIEQAMYLHFYIYHKMGNHFQSQEEWKTFNDEIVKAAEPYYAKFAQDLPPCKPKVRESGKKVIGFLRDRAVENSPYKVEWSLLKALMENEEFRENYEVKLYLMGYIEKSSDDAYILQSFRDLGVEVVDVVSKIIGAKGLYHSHLDKALALRERIIHDEVDILISPNNGYDISDFLLISRSAPKQIFWSHGNGAYDVAGIDQRISHCASEKYFKFQSFTVPIDTKRFYDPPIAPELIESERAKYPKNAVILGTIGRLIKVDSDEYLDTIAKIMHQNANTIYIAAGVGNSESIRAKVESLGISERFFMPGWVNPHIYGHIIDIWCDTFPLEQGESVNEFRAKGHGCGVTICSHATEIENVKLAKKWLNDWHEVYEKFYSKFGFSKDEFEMGYVHGYSNEMIFNRDEYVAKCEKIIRGEMSKYRMPLISKISTLGAEECYKIMLYRSINDILD
ncbi:MAG: hypothetical protein ACTTH5_06885 [Wolinella sp.]